MEKFNYEIKKSKGRNIRISINRQGQVFLHVPRFILEFVAKRFLESKRGWVDKTLDKIRKLPRPVATPSKEGETRAKSTRQIRKEYLEKKEGARILVREKLEFWKVFYKENFSVNFVWKNVSIKNSKTRWGSCSSKKNLNFSFRILELTDRQQDYLIVHELSHLIQMNHSQNFWDLVSLGIPDHKNLRKELKKVRLD